MIIKLLIEKYIMEKSNKPANVNELLDFATFCYLDNKLTINQYRCIMRELVLRGATKPEYSLEEIQTELIG